jgi:hypothetical protein
MTRAAQDLILSARRSLTEATLATSPESRYSAAHLCALRAAAAVLAARSSTSTGRQRVRSVWILLPQIAPEFAEWAEFFAAGARKRASAEAGIRCVSLREADDLVRDSETFLARICESLGFAHQPALAVAVAI